MKLAEHNLTVTHYRNGDPIEGIEEQMMRKPKPLPRVTFVKKAIHEYDVDDFELAGYEAHPAISMPLSV